MSLNYKEIGLILEEANLTGCKIQGVIQNNFHSLTWELYGEGRGRFLFFTEVGTPQSRIHILSNENRLPKTKKLQRFIQFTRKNIEGSVITNCVQMPFDRLVRWDLNNHGRLMKIWISLYSGPGANVIVTDENNVILDLLLRRPGRNEVSKAVFTPEERTQSDKVFEIRAHDGSFNEFIEKTCSNEENQDILEVLKASVIKRMDRELGKLNHSIASARKTLEKNSDYAILKKNADFLAASAYLIHRGDENICLTDWTDGSKIVIQLDKKLSPGDNVNALYEKYQKAKGTFENAKEEITKLENEYALLKKKFEKALEPTEDTASDIKKLRSILEKTDSPTQQTVQTPGLRCTSGGFQFLIGRNAKENDELLRHFVKGNDLWLHTRDYPGGYIFIKYRKEKTVPLDVLLDAANLAVLFSKARNAGTVDLYYTQVKYLRRAKDGKLGLVLPTQEKNLTVTFDRKRADRLLQDVPTEHLEDF